MIAILCEPLECRTLLSVTITTPPAANTIALQDTGGALVVTIDGKATYRLHSGVTILATGGDTVDPVGTIAEQVTVTTQEGDTTTIIESTDNPLTIDGSGTVTIELADPQQTPAFASPHARSAPSPVPIVGAGFETTLTLPNRSDNRRSSLCKPTCRSGLLAGIFRTDSTDWKSQEVCG